MEPRNRPDLSDPDVDPIPGPSVRLRDFDPLEHQRMVVNPFLGVLGLILWWLSARWLLLRGPFPPLAVLTVFGLVFLPYAIQVHCLDCGRTGSYPRRGRHACPGVLARSQARARPHPPLFAARMQLIVWGYVIASAALLMAVLGGPGGGLVALTVDRERSDNRRKSSAH